tara:strand:- start:2185 stop:2457 length:273 start_codon:yes stop_codon:yes gene_type:complete
MLGISTDYEYSSTHKRQRLVIWSGSFFGTLEGDALSLKDGFMVTTYSGDKVRVTCPPVRNESTYRQVDDAISAALDAHHVARGDFQVVSA